jgi:hypothetical protein
MQTRPLKQKMSKNKDRPRNQRFFEDDDQSLRDPRDHYSRREKHRQPNYRDWWNEGLDD